MRSERVLVLWLSDSTWILVLAGPLFSIPSSSFSCRRSCSMSRELSSYSFFFTLKQIIFYNFNQIIIYLSSMNNESWSSIPYLAVDGTSEPPLRVDSSVDDVGRHVRQKPQMWSLLLVLSTLLLQVLAGLCLHQLGLLLGLDGAEDPPAVDAGQHAVVGGGLAGGDPAVSREPVRGVAAGLLLLKIGI